MSKQIPCLRSTRPWRIAGFALAACAACLLSFRPEVSAAESANKPVDPGRVTIGKSLSPSAMILSRQSTGKPWQLVDEKEPVYTGDLLVGLPGARIATENGGVTLNFLSDLDGTSPYPVIESAVLFHGNAKTDADFTLDRGRVDLTNSKKEGAALVRVHVRNEVWDITLTEPGDRVALETYGLWPRGVRFTKELSSKDVPTSDLVILVLRGEVMLKHGGVQMAMRAPPGPSLIEWDSVTGQDNAPRRLEALPPWATSGTAETPKAKAKKEALERFRQRLLKRPLGEVIEDLLNSEDAIDRKIGTYAAGAFDQLDILGKALRESKHPDVWDNGVIALRHWIGRAPGQDHILYTALLEKKHYNPVHAETVLQLLHSFGDEELAYPDVYDALIAFLNHDNLAIRGLAYWHLSRLVPEGKKYGYDATASKENREKAVQEWRKLIPTGQMPPKEKLNPAK